MVLGFPGLVPSVLNYTNNQTHRKEVKGPVFYGARVYEQRNM